MPSPRYIVESKGLDWIVWDRDDPSGREEPRFEGREVECRAVASALMGIRKNGSRKVVEESDNEDGLVELIEAVVGYGRRDPLDVARDLVRTLHLGNVCAGCDTVYMGDSVETCEVCGKELETG